MDSWRCHLVHCPRDAHQGALSSPRRLRLHCSWRKQWVRDPRSSKPIVGVFVRVQDADLVLVDPIAESDDFAAAKTKDVVADIANLERRRWYTSWNRSQRCPGHGRRWSNAIDPFLMGLVERSEQQTRPREEQNQQQSAVVLVHVKQASPSRPSRPAI